MQETETIGETMHPHFEVVRTALDNDQVAALTPEQLTDVHTSFAAGVAQYQTLLGTINQLQPPVRVVGIHKKLVKSYDAYVTSCAAMVQAIDTTAGTVDQAAFDASEKAQDTETDTIAFCIQRMTGLLMK